MDPHRERLSDNSSSASNSLTFDLERENFHRNMLSSVSHDLKTPLASIIGSLEICERMKHKLSPEKTATLIQVALQEAYRLDNFITNILEMAKLENGMVKSRHEQVEISAIVKDCLLRLKQRLSKSTVHVESSHSIETVTDPILLGRTIYLLLENAVKFGGNPSQIYINYGKRDDEYIFIVIRDNGKGIPEEQIENIFSKYTRLAKADQQIAGTGLGLAIGRQIMTLLGGQITASNSPEGGAVFSLYLPHRLIK